jgi:DnaK suppressor protein
MASQRKSASPARTAKPAKRTASRPVKSAAKARPRPAGSAAARHTGSAKPTRKAPSLKKKAVTVQKKKATPVTRKATPVAKKKPVTVPKKKATPVTRKAAPVVKKGAPAAKKAASKAAAPAAKVKTPPRRMKAVARPHTPGPTVRPLGVLPPEARARGIERPSHPPAAPPRPPVQPVRPAKPGAKAPGAQRVTERDLVELETLLLAERVRVMKEMGHLESTVLKVNPRESAGDLSGYSFHMADAGTDAYEREKAFQFASNEGRLLLDLDEALRRLYRGEYGSCESCGNAIGKARLEAMPTARLCRDCKEKEERENRPQQ